METGWTFFSNHGHVLVCIASDPDARLRDVADRVQGNFFQRFHRPRFPFRVCHDQEDALRWFRERRQAIQLGMPR